MMKWLFLFLVPTIVFAKVRTEKVIYEKNGVKMEGLLAYNDSLKGVRPGILVFHDWMGNGANSEMRAKQLAEKGYIAFAGDIYGQGVRPADAKAAGELAGKYRGDRKLMRQRAEAAYETLLAQKNVDKNKTAAIGFCFGGTVALELARAQAPLTGVVSFHGGLTAPLKAATMKTKVLALHGADDPFVPQKEVDEFQIEMRNVKADWTFVSYGNAVHAFTQKEAGSDNTKGAAYNELAEKRAIQAMDNFFKEIL